MLSQSTFKGVTYSQFDNQLGSKLIYSYPESATSIDEFELLSDYVIVTKQLCNKIFIVKSENKQFINYPVMIENPKYFRNAILFAFGFILDTSVDTAPYEIVLKKVSETFVTLEVVVSTINNYHFLIITNLTTDNMLYSWNLNFYFRTKPKFMLRALLSYSSNN